MNWDALLDMLKQFFSNDPTMVLLLTLGFFFLKQIWPTPAPASDQVLQGFAARIRKALELGDRDAARRLADEAIEKTAGYLSAEAEPKPKGFLDIITGLFSNPTLMPLLLIGGVFLMLMLTGGGCKKAAAEPVPVQSLGASINAIRPAFFELDSRAGTVRPAVVQPIGMHADPWAWAGPEPDAQAGPSLPVDRRRSDGSDAGASCDLYRCHAPPVATVAWAPVADCRSGLCRPRQPAGPRAGPVPRLAFQPGQPIRNAARGLARVGRWLRLPGRPVARILRWRP